MNGSIVRCVVRFTLRQAQGERSGLFTKLSRLKSLPLLIAQSIFVKMTTRLHPQNAYTILLECVLRCLPDYLKCGIECFLQTAGVFAPGLGHFRFTPATAVNNRRNLLDNRSG
jgi:hypothetical protein